MNIGLVYSAGYAAVLGRKVNIDIEAPYLAHSAGVLSLAVGTAVACSE